MNNLLILYDFWESKFTNIKLTAAMIPNTKLYLRTGTGHVEHRLMMGKISK